MSNHLIGIIDDDEALCSSLADLMRSIGHRVEPFAAAEAFLTSANLLLFDCIVTDVYMPGMRGLELVRILRQQGGTAPTILITASPDKRLDNEARAVGAQYLLRKPFEAAALVDCVEKSLSNERGSR